MFNSDVKASVYYITVQCSDREHNSRFDSGANIKRGLYVDTLVRTYHASLRPHTHRWLWKKRPLIPGKHQDLQTVD